MTFFTAIIAGLLIGSFLNVCISRLPGGESLLVPGSSCPCCQHLLQWWELIPLLSFLLAKGKCRYCQCPISWRYPLVESLTAAVFAALLWCCGPVPELIRPLLLGSGLIVISFIDLEFYIIPDRILLFLLIGYILTIPFYTMVSPAEMVLGAVTGGALLLLPALLYPGGMGGGDIKLAVLLGLYLGWQLVLLAIFVAALAGSLLGIAIHKFRNKGIKEPIPFGPFLALGALVAIMCGNELLNVYIQLLLR